MRMWYSKAMEMLGHKMGNVRSVLGSFVNNLDRMFSQRLCVDVAENIHLHYRDMRLEFSLKEWVEFSDFISKTALSVNQLIKETGWGEGSKSHKQFSHSLSSRSPKYGGGWKEDGYDPDRFKIELLTDKSTVHIHFFDLRIELSVVLFEKISTILYEAICKTNRLADCVDSEYYKNTKGLFEYESIISVSDKSLYVSIWVPDGTGTLLVKPHESPVFNSVALIEKDLALAEKIYQEYVDNVFLYNSHSKDFANLRDFSRVVRLFDSIKAGWQAFPLVQVVSHENGYEVVDGQHRVCILSYLNQGKYDIRAALSRRT